MSTAIEYEQAIRRVQGQHGLIKLWEKLVDDKYDKSFWKEGKMLEYLVLRGFEIEHKGCVTYPYEVIDENVEYDGPIEQYNAP